MKKFSFPIFVSLILAAPAFAAANANTAVIAEGYVNQGIPNEEAEAKAEAVRSAEGQCGSKDILMAENIGWDIRHNEATVCPPHRPNFCSPEAASVSAKAVFICLSNLPRL